MAHRPTKRHETVLADLPGLALTESDPIGSVVVTGISLDSREVQPGDLYAALPGASVHGATFAAAAAQAGAAAILTDPIGQELAGDIPIPVAVVLNPRAVLGQVSAKIYDDPGASLTLIGVTGTNGKTTMTHLLAAALSATGQKVGVMGTTGARIGEEILPIARTTPEAPDLHALLALMKERGVTVVAMEVSSHALALGRVDGLQFDSATFMNLTQDHLDFHGSMAEYFDAKAALFTEARAHRAVIATDDSWGRQLLAATSIPVESFAVTHDADWTLANPEHSATGAWRGQAHGPRGLVVELASRLPGQFNQSNALGALATLVGLGHDPRAVAAGIATCTGVRGRMESVGSGPFAAFVDYAHTPEAVERAIRAVREFCSGEILVAIGCGGDRDAIKRPDMGRAAAANADFVVVTDDNPRSESPAEIRSAVIAGVDAAAPAKVTEIGDRASAIRELVARARRGDAVLVLGKGHETGQEIAGEMIPFDDREVLEREIAAMEAAE